MRSTARTRKDSRPPGEATGVATRTRLVRGAAATTLVAATALAAAGLGASPASAATVTGTMVTQNLTRPGGGVWLPGGGGHFWVADNVLGLCETVPASLSTTKCNGTAKGGQAVYDPAGGGHPDYVYVADTTSKTNQVLRYTYSAATDSLAGSVSISVPNLTAVGGGTGGGRADAVALVTDPDGVQRLYVAFIKSGDIMQVTNPGGTTRTVSKIGTTADGRGAAALSVFTWKDANGIRHDDLYVAETGGFGLSVIKDVDGTGGRPACGATATPCGATTVTNASGGALFSFPGALVTDGKVLYVGDAPRNTPGRVLSWNPVTGTQDVLSSDITPAYTSQFDGVRRTQYQNITGLALGAGQDLFVGDDPSFPLATPVTAQGHLWKVAGSAQQPVVTGISPATGEVAGGTTLTITGTNLVNKVAGAADTTAYGTTVTFGGKSATAMSCLADGTSCTATSPAAAGAGAVDVRVTNVEGQTSPVTAADQFSYTTGAPPPPSSGPAVTGVSPGTGLATGGTTVTLTGTGLAGATGVSFGAAAASAFTCSTDTSCTATSPGGTDGTTVDVQVTTSAGVSPAVAGDRFTYASPMGTLLSYGITAPKGGITFIPDTTPSNGHFWVSDHGNGLCRLDPVPGAKLSAPNVAACDPGFTIGSPGQAVYDPRTNVGGTHWVYVPDNAVRSPGVWRLTFDPATATISNPVAMAPGLMDNLKTNSLALDPTNDMLYVGDLVDGGIRRITGIGGDPRSQTVTVIAMTQPQKVGGGATGRGINGTMAMLGGRLFLPENNAATYVDVANCPTATGPCSTTVLDFLQTPTPVFVAGVAADPVHKLVYISSSPGTANATVYRVDATTIDLVNRPGGSAGTVYVTAGRVPAAGSPEATVQCSLTCTRPADPALTPGGTTGFPFAQGLYVDPGTARLYVTEDVTAGARSGRGHAWEVPYIP